MAEKIKTGEFTARIHQMYDNFEDFCVDYYKNNMRTKLGRKADVLWLDNPKIRYNIDLDKMEIVA